MKRYIITALAVAAIVTACNNENENENENEKAAPAEIAFTIQGDFTFAPMTRSLTADGRDMTDVWVLDYMGGTLVGTTHQTASDDDFGTPTLPLDYGTHDLYFIASRGTNPTLSTASHTLAFSPVSDTFWRHVSLTVTNSSSTSQAVTLDRIVTRFKIAVSDAMPASVAEVHLIPATWYNSFDYLTGLPATATTNDDHAITIPGGYAGRTDLSFSIFGFSAATEWTTDVTVTALDADDGTVATVTIADAPFVRNRESLYTGRFFTAGSGSTLALNTEWLGSYNGTW